jgi:putative flippase GtrA
LGLGINLGVLVALVELAALHPVLANLVGIVAATVSNFAGNRLFTFRRRG